MMAKDWWKNTHQCRDNCQQNDNNKKKHPSRCFTPEMESLVAMIKKKKKKEKVNVQTVAAKSIFFPHPCFSAMELQIC